MPVWRNSAFTAAVVLIFSGCGGSDLILPPPVPAVGTVTLDGKPLANATVFFRPEGEKMGKGSSAVTDAEGKYKLVTVIDASPQDGAVPGKYRVYFSQLVGPDGKPVVASPDTSPAGLGARESLPMHLSNPIESNQTAEVSASGGTFDFKLSKKAGGGAPTGPGGMMPRGPGA